MIWVSVSSVLPAGALPPHEVSFLYKRARVRGRTAWSCTAGAEGVLLVGLGEEGRDPKPGGSACGVAGREAVDPNYKGNKISYEGAITLRGQTLVGVWDLHPRGCSHLDEMLPLALSRTSLRT